ncbi:MAG TPA: ABC transporter permease [Puia sp.]|nr:ABC transporter permease [Puia sp.]
MIFAKTAFRSLLKNKGFTFLNVLGLTLGLATCLLILFYVTDELSYDRYNTNADRIFRVNTDVKLGSNLTSFAIAAPPASAALTRNFPEIESSVRLLKSQSARFKKGNQDIKEYQVANSDPGIFSIFTLPMLEGDPNTALTNPNSVVISAGAAKKYFNTTHAIGKILEQIGDSDHITIYTVTGVMRDIPTQSHFNFDFLLSMESIPESRNTNFYSIYPFSTYILLRPGVDPQRLEAKFPAFMRRALTTGGYSYDAFEKGGNYMKLNLTPLTDIHLTSNRTDELGPNGNRQYVSIFSAAALLILLIACVNFMNLSTARSANRAREVGVRKVLGSPRKYLIAQFLSESVLITLAATLLAVVAAWALLPLFNQLSGKTLAITAPMLGWLLPCLGAIVIVVGVLAGSYPAFFLSAFQPIDVLKGKLAMGFKGGRLRSALVVFQFSISIFLIIGTLVIYHQLHYIQSKDLGFDRNQVLVIKNTDALRNPRLLQQEIKSLPGVLNITLSSFIPTGSQRWHNFGTTSTSTHPLGTEFWPVDTGYLNTMGIQLSQGRNFSSQLSSDSSAIIVNETAARMLGYAGAPLDKKVTYSFNGGQREFHIIGVVKDFNFNSLRDNITPLAMVMAPGWEDNLSVRIQPAQTDLPALLAQLEDKWRTFAPRQHFVYSFMDEDFDALYRTEQRLGRLFGIFTFLAIIIACLGLFGLAAYAAEQRHREIGIRKILGAEVSALVLLLSRDFIKWVLLAVLIAVPLAWWAMSKWLESYAYRDSLPWWVLAIAALSALVIAFITISFQSIRAALANPVDSLRAE